LPAIWNTKLVPIPIDDEHDRNIVTKFKGWDDLPGLVGVLVILLEEDSLPDDAVTAGYNTMVRTVEQQVNAVIPTLGILNPNIPPEVDGQIKNAVAAAVKNTIREVLDFPTKVAAWIAGPDDFLGVASWRKNHDELAKFRTIPLEQRWKQGVSVDFDLLEGPGGFITSGGEWILKGSITVT
jgi:hypothetical protein